ncbi:MAG TPA: hypothetical protein VEO54_27905 [Thermoanaerobaculia bacterium]|nr:hypothetical protein [Thermoanaerobaculia bacterium]
MSCDSFRKRFHAGTEDAALLEHLRSCDRCLDFAVHADPDVMFRSLGGDEMMPPGGLDAFVSGVMQQVRVREAETVASKRGVTWPRRLAMAAALGAAVFGATLVYRVDAPVAVKPMARVAAVQRAPLTTKPVVAAYDSQNATIVEVPSEGADDVKIVMVFDENLPADL